MGRSHSTGASGRRARLAGPTCRRETRSTRVFVVSAVLVVGVWAAVATAAPDALERVRAAGVLRWCGDLQGGEPYVFQDPASDAGIVGFEVEIAAALARRLGVRAEFV